MYGILYFSSLQPFKDGVFFEFEERKYCEHDFNVLFAPCCGKCKTFIIGRVIKAMNNSWHPDCFRWHSRPLSFAPSNTLTHLPNAMHTHILAHTHSRLYICVNSLKFTRACMRVRASRTHTHTHSHALGHTLLRAHNCTQLHRHNDIAPCISCNLQMRVLRLCVGGCRIRPERRSRSLS